MNSSFFTMNFITFLAFLPRTLLGGMYQAVLPSPTIKVIVAGANFFETSYLEVDPLINGNGHYLFKIKEGFKPSHEDQI